MDKFIVKPNKTVKEIIEYRNRCPYAVEAEARREAAIDNYYQELLCMDSESSSSYSQNAANKHT